MLIGRRLVELKEFSHDKAEAWAKSKLGIPEGDVHAFLYTNFGGWTWVKTNVELL